MKFLSRLLAVLGWSRPSRLAPLDASKPSTGPAGEASPFHHLLHLLEGFVPTLDFRQRGSLAGRLLASCVELPSTQLPPEAIAGAATWLHADQIGDLCEALGAAVPHHLAFRWNQPRRPGGHVQNFMAHDAASLQKAGLAALDLFAPVPGLALSLQCLSAHRDRNGTLLQWKDVAADLPTERDALIHDFDAHAFTWYEFAKTSFR